MNENQNQMEMTIYGLVQQARGYSLFIMKGLRKLTLWQRALRGLNRKYLLYIHFLMILKN